MAAAALLAVVGDALLSDGITGVAFPLWTSLVALSLVALAWRADLVVTREAAAWFAVAVVSSIGLAWRNAEMLQFLNFCGAVGGLVLGAATINRPGSLVFAPRLTDAAFAIARFCRKAVPGIIPLIFSEASEQVDGRRLESRAVVVARVAVVVFPLLLIFGSLLRGADPIFASMTTIPALDAGLILRHTIVILFLCVAVGGWARAALLAKQVDAADPSAFIRLGSLEVTAGLVTLNVLFAAFVLSQLGWFFGGERFLHNRTGLTAAEYARRGFFQMVWVVALVVPLLVASRALLAQGRALARRHTMLSLPIVGLLGVMIVSAALRMKLYVQYFGLSTDRFYPLVFMLWLGVVLAWLAVTVLRGWNRPFLAGVAGTACATLVTLNVIAPDRLVAKVNIERASTRGDSASVDVRYLANLGGEASDLAVQFILSTPLARVPQQDRAARCDAMRRLVARWGSGSAVSKQQDASASWRTWNAGEAAALQAVGESEGRLSRLLGSECPQRSRAPNQR